MKNPDLVLGYNLGRSPVSCTPALWDPPDNFLLLGYLECFDGKPHKDDQAASLSQVFRLRQVPEFRSRGRLGSIASTIPQCPAGPAALAF